MSSGRAATEAPLQLSLFDTAAAPSPAPAPPAPSTAGGATTPGVHTVPPPSTPKATTPAPADYTHSAADREIRLGDCRVAYALRRARRKSIGFSVGPEGLAVSAPRWVGQGDIEAALREKAGWILRKLSEQRERSRRMQASRVEWRDGTSLPFLGETVIVVLDPRVAGAVLNSDAEALPGVPRLTLHVGLPQQAEPAQIRDVVQSWLQRQARRIFEERCRLFADRLGVRMSRLTLSAAQTRWGSASADGSVRLNWRLVHFGMSVIDYVVAHELAHLREMNHSPAFWDVVRSVVPDFEQLRGSLRTEVLPLLD